MFLGYSKKELTGFGIFVSGFVLLFLFNGYAGNFGKPIKTLWDMFEFTWPLTLMVFGLAFTKMRLKIAALICAIIPIGCVVLFLVKAPM